MVYDPRRDRLHFLNGTALFILECLDGTTGIQELPALVAAAFRLSAPPVGEVTACLERFAAEGLIDPDPAPGNPPGPGPGPSPQSR